MVPPLKKTKLTPVEREALVKKWKCKLKFANGKSCNYATKRKDNLSSHVKNKHTKKKCDKCIEEFDDQDELDLHFKLHHQKIFTCSRNHRKKDFRTFGSFEQHLLQCPDVQGQVQCEVCQKYFVNLELLMWHLHKIETKKDAEIGKMLYTASLNKNPNPPAAPPEESGDDEDEDGAGTDSVHVRLLPLPTTPPPAHKCICERVFANGKQCNFSCDRKTQLAVHVESRHTKKECNDCKREFDDQDELDIHYKLQHQKTFRCSRNHQTRKFHNAETFQEHLFQCPDVQGQVQCDICQQYFINEVLLMWHLHTIETMGDKEIAKKLYTASLNKIQNPPPAPPEESGEDEDKEGARVESVHVRLLPLPNKPPVKPRTKAGRILQCKLQYSSGRQCQYTTVHNTLTRHTMSHHTKKKCDKCNMEFYDKDEMDIHDKLHHKTYFSCSRNHRKKDFRTFESFEKHLILCPDVTGQVQCDICQQLFINEVLLMWHLHKVEKIGEAEIAKQLYIASLSKHENPPPPLPEDEDEDEEDEGASVHVRFAPPSTKNSTDPISTSGERASTTLIHHPGITILYDTVLQEPVWVKQTVTQSNAYDKSEVQDKFRKDPNVADNEQHQRHQHWPGYDRGHLAEKNLHRHLINPNFMTLVSPQTAEMNRGRWSSTENTTIKQAKRHHETDIIAGPLGTLRTITLPNGEILNIPKFYWKLLRCYDSKNNLKYEEAWFLEHEPQTYQSIEEGETTVDKLEERVNLNFPLRVEIIE